MCSLVCCVFSSVYVVCSVVCMLWEDAELFGVETVTWIC